MMRIPTNYERKQFHKRAKYLIIPTALRHEWTAYQKIFKKIRMLQLYARGRHISKDHYLLLKELSAKKWMNYADVPPRIMNPLKEICELISNCFEKMEKDPTIYFRKERALNANGEKEICQLLNVIYETLAELEADQDLDDDICEFVVSFSTEITKRCILDYKYTKDNILLSPLSIIELLTMLQNGAAGKTYEEFVQVLGFDKQKMSVFLNYIRTGMSSLKKENQIKIPNGVHLKTNYKNLLQTQYEVRTLYSEDESIHISNTILFDSAWSKQYEKSDIESGTFTNWKHRHQSVTMLRSCENIFVRDEKVYGFMKPYRGREYVFMALLPHNETLPWKLLATMENGYFTKLSRNAEHNEDIEVIIPEFSINFEVSLKQSLKKMGIVDCFINSADFSNMVDTSQTYVDDIVQKSQIIVNPGGTKAAAHTESIVYAGAIPRIKQLYFDRPFIYAIMHVRTGIPVFIGMVNSIEEQNTCP